VSRKGGRRRRQSTSHSDGIEIVDPTAEDSDPRPTPLEVIGLITLFAVGAVVGRWLGAFLAGTAVMGVLGLLLLAVSALIGRGETLAWVLTRWGVKVVQRELE